MSAAGLGADDEVDKSADEQIAACLDLVKPQSFFLFAGAGSGKTRSLVNALKHVKANYDRMLQTKGRRVAVITYTKAARDEIKQRLEHDPLIQVNTIHAFLWALIKGHNNDIREWVRGNLKDEIEDLEERIAKGRPGTKVLTDNQKKLERNKRRLEKIEDVKVFAYNPDGDNRSRDSLGHGEVLKIGASFLTENPGLRAILISRFPILLIDESQDTNKGVMTALLTVQAEHRDTFSLGLFGDTMQRIYADGLVRLEDAIPPEWATPAKKMNHRCPKRVVELINKIRSQVDDQRQQPRSDAEAGVVRAFIIRSDRQDKRDLEVKVVQKMQELSGDRGWTEGIVKTLTIEHHMAAVRMGFLPMLDALNTDRLKTAFSAGDLAPLNWFRKTVFPVAAAARAGDPFKVAAVVRKESPLLDRQLLRGLGDKQPQQIEKVQVAVDALSALWGGGRSPTFGEVFRCVRDTGLFSIPEGLKAIADRSPAEQAIVDALGGVFGEAEGDAEDVNAYDGLFLTPFDQIEHYDRYVDDLADFGTHQGVKGLEFERVMVVADDEQARGFSFSYEKLFGAKDPTAADIKNQREGKETGLDRTRRLFYVTCSRAECGLAIVCYTEAPDTVKKTLIAHGWFAEQEIEMLD